MRPRTAVEVVAASFIALAVTVPVAFASRQPRALLSSSGDGGSGASEQRGRLPDAAAWEELQTLVRDEIDKVAALEQEIRELKAQAKPTPGSSQFPNSNDLASNDRKRHAASSERPVNSPWSSLDPDPSVLRWSPDGGNLTCAMMTVPLKHNKAHDPNWPTTQVHVCIRLCDVQPAPKGLLFTHCGGPGSGSLCGIFHPAMLLTDQLIQEYDLVAIDQRGISLLDEGSLNTLLGDNSTGIPVPFGLDGEFPPVFDEAEGCTVPLDEFEECGDFCEPGLNLKGRLLHIVRKRYEAMDRCESSPEFQIELGNGETANWLDCSGTYELVRDLDILREALGAEKLSLYGISYGTQVAAAYATIFPEHTDKMILDSTVPTDQNVMSWSTSMGQGWQQFCDHLIEACRETDDCAIQGDVYKTINTLSNDLASGSIAVTASDGQTVPLPPIALWERLGSDPSTWAPWFELVANLTSSDPVLVQDTAQLLATDMPANSTQWSVIWKIILLSTPVPTLINGQDLAGRFSPEYLLEEFEAAQDLYPVWFATFIFATEAIKLATFREPHPLPTLGNPSTAGIVYGALYDPNTPYQDSQAMHAAFPGTSMVTGQFPVHGLSTDVYGGVSTRTTGTVCLERTFMLYLIHDELPPNGMTCFKGSSRPPVSPSLLALQATYIDDAV